MRLKQCKIIKRIFSIVISLAIVVGLTSYFGDINEVYAANSHMLADNAKKAASIANYEISLDGAEKSSRDPKYSFAASCPKVITLLDQNKNVNVAYFDGEKLIIQKYKNDMSLDKILEIPSEYPLFGNAICDDEGYYYAVWGRDDEDCLKNETIFVLKYDNNGKEINSLSIIGEEAMPWHCDSSFGTRYPFDLANCDMAVSDGMLAINYGMVMYNGHQASMALFIETTEMVRRYGDTSYNSHSFDQRIYSLPNYRFLLLNQSDGYPSRAFDVSIQHFKNSNGKRLWDKSSMNWSVFHFREGLEGSKRGYNWTFAQLGGMAEINNGLMFTASSERSLSAIPKNNAEDTARDLFIQLFEKKGDSYTLKPEGEKRVIQGQKPSCSEVELQLRGDEEDEGIIWLTAYDDAHYAANPHIVSLGGNKTVVLWEKRAYADRYLNGDISSIETYYAVIDGSGKVVVDTTRIYDCLLAADTDPVVKNGKVYWATNDDYGSYIHCLDPLASKEIVYPTGIAISKKSLTINKGDTFDLTVAVSPSNASFKNAIWSSDDERIVQVDAKGRITAVNAGSTKINATINGLTSSCDVTVIIPLKKVSFTESNITLNAGNGTWLKLVYDPIYTTESKEIKWKSSDENIASISSNGFLSGINPGTVTITAEISGKKATCTVVVEGNPLKSISIPESISLNPGEKRQLTVTYEPYNTTDSKEVIWSSSDTKVATVDSTGKIEAIGPGTATITAKCGDLEDSCIVIVEGKESNKEKDNSKDDSNTNDNRGAGNDNNGNKDAVTDEDNFGSPYRIDGLNCAWNYSGGKYYWYENGIKQGTFYDPAGVVGDGTVRGREIYDSVSDGWYWLDSVYNGAKAVGKEVWMPYIYQDEDTWNEEVKRNVAYESDEGMGECVFVAITNKSGKWVRYDENGKMLKGWITIDGSLAGLYPEQAGNTYYYDSRTGLMAKGKVTIDGVEHFFNETSGVLEW